ncbi:hypothetical protein ACQKII_20020 [Lysinibacillus sp. NPDC048646]|uniref:hypothetical protein n=1 Tax=Lysinibacillus sp. NPDC048646 TaxID=3390574 RepID=UPI003D053801
MIQSSNTFFHLALLFLPLLLSIPLAFSIEHPIATAQNPMQGWICNEEKEKVY